MPTIHQCDLAIVGGGLSGALIALAAAKRRPDARIRLIEGAAQFGGNHVWSFFGSDVATEQRALVAKVMTGKLEKRGKRGERLEKWRERREEMREGEEPPR